MRTGIVKKFMNWAYWKEHNRWTEANDEERIIIKRQVFYGRCLVGFGLFANAAVYQAIFTGIYNWRTKELLDTKRVPFPVKIAVSGSGAYYLCSTLWNDMLYDPDLYRLAVKYRPFYDEQIDKEEI